MAGRQHQGECRAVALGDASLHRGFSLSEGGSGAGRLCCRGGPAPFSPQPGGAWCLRRLSPPPPAPGQHGGQTGGPVVGKAQRKTHGDPRDGNDAVSGWMQGPALCLAWQEQDLSLVPRPSQGQGWGDGSPKHVARDGLERGTAGDPRAQVSLSTEGPHPGQQDPAMAGAHQGGARRWLGLPRRRENHRAIA